MKDLWTCDYCSCIDIDINALPSPAPLKQYGGCFDTSLKGIAATSVPSVCIYLCNIRQLQEAPLRGVVQRTPAVSESESVLHSSIKCCCVCVHAHSLIMQLTPLFHLMPFLQEQRLTCAIMHHNMHIYGVYCSCQSVCKEKYCSQLYTPTAGTMRSLHYFSYVYVKLLYPISGSVVIRFFSLTTTKLNIV